MGNNLKEHAEHGAEFWKRLKLVIGNEKPFAWASRVGIPKSTFSHCMSSGALLPLKHLIKVADATGISLKWLITGELSEHEQPVGILAGDGVIRELIECAWSLSAEKQRMVLDIVKRIAEEEKERAGKKRRGTGAGGR